MQFYVLQVAEKLIFGFIVFTAIKTSTRQW